jgi:tetratricopeptide (TPR) repeat protein
VASLKLFGGASIETPAGPLTGRAAQRRRIALLALLATSRGMAREKLASYLWPEHDLERGRHLLSDSVYRVNQALGGDTVSAAGDELRLDPRLLACDAADFEDALQQGRPAEAVALYRGPFLDGFFLDGAQEFERWAERERERFARLYTGALEALAEESERTGDPRRATEWWFRLAAHDPLSPRVAIRLMQALDAAGECAAAIRHARVHEALFREEFGAEAHPEVAELRDRLLAEPAARVAERPEEPGRRATAAAAPPQAEPPQSAAPRGDAPPSPAPAAESAPQAQAAGPLARRPRIARLAGLAALPLAAAAGVALVWPGDGGPTPAGRSPAVTVLPFADHSPAGDHAYFGSGLTEEITRALTRVDGLRVVAHAPAPAAGGQDLQEVGRRLGVEAVLQGSISRWGDSVRVNAALVRVADRAYLWSGRYTSPMGSIFAIQDSISRAIAATLTERLVGATAPAPAPSAEELEAYNLYLRGRYAWHRRTEESLAAAVAYFEEAVAWAPSHARSHAGLADAYAVQGFYDFRPPTDAFPRAAAAARRALALDPTLAQPHATLGYVDLYYRWSWDEAEEAFRQAIQLDPRNSTAHQWYGNYLTAMGRFPEAERSMRRAMELDPLSLIASAALGWVHYMAGDYEQAVEQCGRTLELDPRFSLAYLWLGLAHEQLGRPEEAVRTLERSLEVSPGSAIVVAALAGAHAAAGRPHRARALLDELLAGEPGYLPSYEVAKVHLALGEREQALAWLEKAYDQRSHSMAFLRVDPQLARLRSDPRFHDLLRRVGHRP